MGLCTAYGDKLVGLIQPVAVMIVVAPGWRGERIMDSWALAIVIATFCGPAVAIQIQKWIERRRVRSDDKEAVFRTLMSTRATRLSEDHVKALNMIDIAYRGGLPKKRTKTENDVVNRWAEYKGHLFVDQTRMSESQQQNWVTLANTLFASLLEAMAVERGYVFDKHALGTGGYWPMAHGYTQMQQEHARYLLLEVLKGNRSIPMSITAIHVNAG